MLGAGSGFLLMKRIGVAASRASEQAGAAGLIDPIPLCQLPALIMSSFTFIQLVFGVNPLKPNHYPSATVYNVEPAKTTQRIQRALSVIANAFPSKQNGIARYVDVFMNRAIVRQCFVIGRDARSTVNIPITSVASSRNSLGEIERYHKGIWWVALKRIASETDCCGERIGCRLCPDYRHSGSSPEHLP
jgi:hypothetical protein